MMPIEQPDSSHQPSPQKIAILGGGVGGLAAAFGLTNRPGWQKDYEVTVYQMGWRLGGKGASGRNQEKAGRIEEHGLHIWYGFYDNAFRLIQQCYEELGRPPEAPLSRWEQAFQPHRWVLIEEFHDDRWKPWPLDFPLNPHIPGQSDRYLSPWGYFKQLLEWIFQSLLSLLQGRGRLWNENRPVGDSHPAWLANFLKKAELNLGMVELQVATRLLQVAQQLSKSIDPLQSISAERLQTLTRLLKQLRLLMWRLFQPRLEGNDLLRRSWILFELATVSAYGMLVDNVIFAGFEAVDQWDYREWLRRHGATDLAIYSAPVRALYDVSFAYPRGEVGPDSPATAGSLAAGVALQCILMILFSYKGAVLWKMQAGMGDVVFAPLYQVLKARGVKFKFFYKVTGLELSPDRQQIDKIKISLQATLKAGLEDYEPLIEVKNLPCWPDRPLYDQLEQGEALVAQQVNLESAWADWPEVANLSLQRGEDFDRVVLGIPIGALPPICGELIQANPHWQAMIEHVQTVPTQAFQLWLKPTLPDLGWPAGQPILDGYVQPFNTWSDMTQTLDWEDWPPDHQPGHVAYFCGPLADPTPPFDALPGDPTFPARENERVKATAIAWLRKNIGGLWPNTGTPVGDFNWSLLVDPAGREGAARFEAQSWRANIEPSDRYVSSPAGSTHYRLKSGESGFANLYLAGDWTQNGLNVGCVEAAVMSGLQAAEALSGYSQNIIGSLNPGHEKAKDSTVQGKTS